MDASSDEELMARIAAGDEVAFGLLARRYLRRSLGLARRITGNDAGAGGFAAGVAQCAALASGRRLPHLVLPRGRQFVQRVEASIERAAAALAAPLPPQRQPRLTILWPTELLDLEFSIAWRPIAALAVVALLGFAVGLSDGRFLGAPQDNGLLSTIFEPDLLPGLRQ